MAKGRSNSNSGSGSKQQRQPTTAQSSSSIDPPLHQSLLDQQQQPVIDPALADLVDPVDQPASSSEAQAGPSHGNGQQHDGVTTGINHGADDPELDPDWREIVNSLNQASQSNDVQPGDLAQPQAGPSHEVVHLAEHDERDRVQQTLQNTLDNFTEESLSVLFPSGFPPSPPAAQFGLVPDQPTPLVASTSTAPPPNGDVPIDDTADPTVSAARRGRGRPKGSKNKYKPIPKPRKPRRKKSPPPKRPRGRPPKERDPEEQAAWEEKRARKQLGVTNRKGRPRKFPGFLVREMRLRRNRDEYIRLLRDYEEVTPEDQRPRRRGKNQREAETRDEGQYHEEDDVRRALEGQAFDLDQALDDPTAAGDQLQGGDDADQGVDGMFPHPWESQGQSLLEVVDAAAAAEAARQAEEAGAPGPSGHSEQAVEDMQRVFRLDGDGDETMGLVDGVMEEVAR